MSDPGRDAAADAASDAASGADLTLTVGHQAVRELHRRRRPRPHRRAGQVLRAARPVRMRQDDHAAHGGRARGADQGRDQLGGQDITHLKPYKRPVNTVFQSYALFPHLDIFENVAFGLRRRGVKDVNKRVHDMLELVELGGYGKRRPAAALGRPAAAGRAGPCADQPAAGAAARRAARRARPQAPPADADRAQAHPDRGRHHLRPRHPRPGGGHDDGRHHRGDEPGRDRAAGAAHELYDQPATTFVSNFLGQSNLVRPRSSAQRRRRRPRGGRPRLQAAARRGRARVVPTGRCGWGCGPRRCSSRAAR